MTTPLLVVTIGLMAVELAMIVEVFYLFSTRSSFIILPGLPLVLLHGYQRRRAWYKMQLRVLDAEGDVRERRNWSFATIGSFVLLSMTIPTPQVAWVSIPLFVVVLLPGLEWIKTLAVDWGVAPDGSYMPRHEITEWQAELAASARV